MAANFTISDSESSEELEEENSSAPDHTPDHTQLRLKLALPELREAGSGRIRLSSESHVEEVKAEDEPGTPTEGLQFRGRSKSAPPALWAAKKYGRQLRRMSDEFDSLLDKGEMKKTRPIQHSKTWWSYLFSHQETEAENNHHESHRTE
ncbi:BCL2 associated agonist of cell death b [Eucyclogobius newberryi]|uniref:BCL2 associated agonist of cell death b n=1 Tax=Eucyclogobius newberryi TaxID=166745 RepID=UPI003B5B0F49